MRKVMIDPGHGGTDPGAVNGEHKEAVIALQISKAVGTKLIAAGYSVKFTRKRDSEKRPSNKTRCIMANEWEADIFVAIHLNSTGTPGPSGHEVIYCPASFRGSQLAKFINSSLPGCLKDRRAKTDESLNRGFKLTVLWKTNMPAVIVECCFISNPDDLKYILTDEGKESVVNGIVSGISKFFDSEKGLRDGGY